MSENKLKNRIEKLMAGRLGFVVMYTVLFALTSLFVFWNFMVKGKTMIYSNDGYYQHYNSLVYYGNYLRELLRALIAEHTLRMPMLDMSIGLGSDILTTLHYYVMGDPLYLLTVAVPSQYMEYFYTLLIILRMYLAGLAFSAFALYHGNDRVFTALGALLYCFSGYMLIPGVKHIMFEPAAIYLPLVLLGLEKIIRKERAYLFVIATALAACSNFYFFFMIVVFAVIYAVFRWFMLNPAGEGESPAKWILRNAAAIGETVGRVLLWGALALGIAAIVLLPVIMAMLSSERMGVHHYMPLLYEWKYYLVNFSGFMTGEYLTEGTFYTFFGFTAMGVLGCALLIASKGKNKALKTAFAMLLVFAIIPFFGYAISGFSYVNNRWLFAFSCFVSYVFTKSMSRADDIEKKQAGRAFAIIAVYGVLCYISQTDRSVAAMAGIALALAGAFLILMRSGVSGGDLSMSERRFRSCFAVLTVLAAAVNSTAAFGDIDGMLPRHIPTNSRMHNPTAAIEELGDDGVYRFEAERITDTLNMSWHNGTMSNAFYFSVLNGNVSKFFTDYNVSNTTEYRFESMDARAALDIFSAVKYALVRDGKEHRLPFSYSEKAGESTIGDVYGVYRSDIALPLGYTYDGLISKADYEAMDAPAKQDALLQGVYLEDYEEGRIKSADVTMSHVKPEYTISSEGAVDVYDDHFFVKEKGASVTFSFDGVPGSETYLRFTGLDYSDVDPVSLMDTTGMSVYDRLQNAMLSRNFVPEDKGAFFIDGNGHSDYYTINNSRQPAYSGKHDYMYNTYYSEDGIDSVSIRFSGIGTYSFDKAEIVCQPMDTVEKSAVDRAGDVLEDVQLRTNEISGHISSEEPEVMCLAVPFSKGFKAYVDGSEVRIYKANTMYMGIVLEPGEHDVRFTYATPFLGAGALVTLVSLIIFAGIVLRQRKRTR